MQFLKKESSAKVSRDEVILSLFHGNNELTLHSESQRVWRPSASFVSCEPANSQGTCGFTANTYQQASFCNAYAWCQSSNFWYFPGEMLDEVTAVVDGYNAYFSFSKVKTGYSGEA